MARIKQSFESEEKNLAKLKGYSNIIQLVESFQDDQFYYLVLELAECGDLYALLESHRFAPLPEIVVK